MEQRTVILKSLEYIEANLQSELSAAELAQQSGFSVFHYYRLFRQHTGLPVMKYILRRRLAHAIYAIRNGEKRIDAALAYGFDTYAGFYKAFQREFGCTPSEFLQKNRAKRPSSIDLMKEENMYLSHRTARDILKHWQMENETIADCYYENSGNRAENAVRVGDKHILKRVRSLPTMQTNLALAQELWDAGADAQFFVPTADGRLYVQADEWYFAVYRCVEGSAVNAAAFYGEGGLVKARFVGEVIGQLHLILRKAEIEVREANLLQTVREWALPRAQELLHLPEDFCQSWLAAFERMYPLLPRQIIHRDPNPGNILLADEGWGMIDFDLAERNARLFDPCYAATAVLSESFDEKNEAKQRQWLAIYQNILTGYDSVAGLTAEEKAAAPSMILANQFVCTAWFAAQTQYPEIYETNRRMTTWLVRHFEALKLE